MRDDPRLGRRLSIDPKAASFPGVSPYVSMGNNPIMMVDPLGDWYWIANNNKKIVNDLSTAIKMESDVFIVTELRNESLKELQLYYNNHTKIWGDPNSPNYAPTVAKYVSNKDNKIPIVIAEIEVRAAGKTLMKDSPLAIDRPIVLNSSSIKASKTLFHETLHNMGYGEFETYSAQFAANYSSTEFEEILGYKGNMFVDYKENMKNLKQKSELHSSLINSVPEGFDISPYLEDTGLEIEDVEGLVSAMKKYGKKVIGTDE